MFLRRNKNTITTGLTTVLALAALSACNGGNAEETEAAAPSSNSVAQSPSQATPEPTGQEPAQIDPVAQGKKVFRSCVSCHSVEKAARHRVGPNLWDIYGATAGAKEGFSYSDVMRDSGIVWNDTNLNGFLENPRQFMPDNRMSFGGIRNAEKRGYLIEYMKTLSENE